MPSSNPENSSPVGNPVIPVYAADPHADLFGDKYYIYATNAGLYSSKDAFHDRHEGEAHGFAAWSSTDLRNWKNEGRILRFTDIKWAKDLGDAWAPCMAERNGKYYFYFCAKSSIGVAVGDTPLGPFVETLGAPMIPFRPDMSAIDPMVFVDDDGQAYFYWGAVPGSWLEGRGFEILMHLSVRKLSDDMMTFASEEISTITTEKSPGGWHELNHIEATHVFKRNGLYYLMWSPGSFDSNDVTKTYRVHYATSDSPLGPWKLAPNNPVLSSRRDIEVVGPGHHSTIQIPGTDEWYCVYHCHKGNVDRRTFIDRMTFDAEGNIETIIPTLEGPPEKPVRVALSIAGKGPYSSKEGLTLTVTATGEVEKIEFLSGTEVIGEAPAGSTTFRWSEPAIGFHRLSARVTFVSGEVATAAAFNTDVL